LIRSKCGWGLGVDSCFLLNCIFVKWLNDGKRLSKRKVKSISLTEHTEKGGFKRQKLFSHRVRRARGERRIGKSKAFLSQSTQSTRRKAGLNVKSIFLTESAEHAEKSGFKSQNIFSQSTRSTQRKAGLKVKSFFGRGFSRIKRGLESQKHFSHRARGEKRIGKSKSKAYSPPEHTCLC